MTDQADELRIEPLTSDRWDDVVALFSEGGDPKTCWCTFWRLRNAEWSLTSRVAQRERLRSMAGDDPPAGLLAYDGDRAVGWVSLGPRDAFDRLEHSRVRPRLDDLPVWSIVCFVVSRTARRRGVSRFLLDAAVSFARSRGAPAVEAYPVDPAGGRVPAATAYTGLLPMFEDAGFRVARDVVSPQATVRRVIVRLELSP